MSAQAPPAVASVVIPAYNEGAVISRCLDALRRQDVGGPLEIVVAANGCTDDTVARARAVTGVTVVNLASPGKAEALNAGDAVATAYPRIYLDADIELGPGALAGMIAGLTGPEPRVAAPRVNFDTAAASRWVRSYYAAFSVLPYATRDMVGLGVYGMSASGRARFGRFPDLLADDLFVQRMFAPDERLVTPGTFTVRVPRDLRNLIAVRTRVARGNAQLAAADQDRLPITVVGSAEADFSPTSEGTASAMIGLAGRQPRLWPALGVYTGVTLAARLRARRTASASTWDRDCSTREAPTRGSAPPAAATGPGQRRIAYLNSQYPALSHTFIEREIAAVRDQGWQVATFSVRPCPPGQLKSRAMVTEFERTRVIQADKANAVAALGRLGGRHHAALAAASALAARSGDATMKGKTWQAFYLAEAVVLHEWLRDRGLRHVHVHMANVSADVARLVVAIGEAIDGPGTWSWSLTVHGYAEFQYVDQWDVPAKIRGALGIAAVSDFTRSQLMRLTTPDQWHKIEVVHMSVDPQTYAPPRSPRDHDGPLRVITVGRLVALKGIPTLIDAILLLAARGVPTHARVIGDGEDMADLRRRVEAEGLTDSVELVGAVGQDDMPGQYQWADAYVLPSFMEGLPTVLMEAMATELPAVATNISGVAELVVDGDSGLLVRPGRADLLADAIERLARDPELRVRLGRGGRAAVLAEFTPATTGPAMAAFLDRTLARR